jgi:hypothetical protein
MESTRGENKEPVEDEQQTLIHIGDVTGNG